MREGKQRNTTTEKELGSDSTARPWGYLVFIVSLGLTTLRLSWLSAMIFPLEEFHSVQTVLLAILVSSPGPEASNSS